LSRLADQAQDLGLPAANVKAIRAIVGAAAHVLATAIGNTARNSAIIMMEAPSPTPPRGLPMIAEILLIGGTLLTAAGQVVRIVKVLK